MFNLQLPNVRDKKRLNQCHVAQVFKKKESKMMPYTTNNLLNVIFEEHLEKDECIEIQEKSNNRLTTHYFSSVKDAISEIEHMNGDLFVNISPRRMSDKKIENVTGFMARVNFIHNGENVTSRVGGKISAESYLLKPECFPTFIIYAGENYYVAWLLKESIAVTDKEKINHIQNILNDKTNGWVTQTINVDQHIPLPIQFVKYGFIERKGPVKILRLKENPNKYYVDEIEPLLKKRYPPDRYDDIDLLNLCGK